MISTSGYFSNPLTDLVPGSREGLWGGMIERMEKKKSWREMYLCFKAATIASEKGCFQKEVERAERTVPVSQVHPGWSLSLASPPGVLGAQPVGWGE